MKQKFRLRPIYCASLCLVALVFSGCGNPQGPSSGEHDAEQTAGDYERGAHGGRILRDGDFAVEITIFEEGVPPEFHVYAYEDDKPLDADQIKLSLELGRLGGKTDRFAFKPEGDYLKGDAVVKEPHSFDVKVTATGGGKTSTWSYASYEGRVQIASEAAEAALLSVESAGPSVIREQLSLTGVVQADPARLVRVRARFAGVVRAVRKGLGDAVPPAKYWPRCKATRASRVIPSPHRSLARCWCSTPRPARPPVTSRFS